MKLLSKLLSLRVLIVALCIVIVALMAAAGRVVAMAEPAASCTPADCQLPTLAEQTAAAAPLVPTGVLVSVALVAVCGACVLLGWFLRGRRQERAPRPDSRPPGPVRTRRTFEPNRPALHRRT